MPIFEINKNSVKGVKAKDFPSEKALQNLVENNLETIFSCRFIATEFVTGDEHGGRIDTLALSEDNNPVIIEYKTKEASDLINQSLFYLHWLNDHKGDFINAVNNKFGHNKQKIDWSYIRVVCIAPRFKKYDLLAVKAMGVNIELWQFKLYENNMLYLEEVFRKEAGISSGKAKKTSVRNVSLTNEYTFEEHYNKTKETFKPILNDLREHLLNIDTSVNENPKKLYVAYSSTQNFACIIPRNDGIRLFLKIDPDTLSNLPKNFRDMRNVGHNATGDFRLNITNEEQFEEAKKYIQISFKNVGG